MQVRATYTVKAEPNSGKYKNLDCYLKDPALEKELGEMRDQAIRDFVDAYNKIILLGGKILPNEMNDSSCTVSVAWTE